MHRYDKTIHLRGDITYMKKYKSLVRDPFDFTPDPPVLLKQMGIAFFHGMLVDSLDLSIGSGTVLPAFISEFK